MTDKQYAPNKRVHSILKKILWPHFKAHDWQKRPGSSCAFVRRAQTGFWCFWIQVSQWGSSLDGNTFTVNLVEQPEIESPLAGAENARVLADLSAEDKDLAHGLAIRIQSRVPDPPPEHKVHEWKRLPGKEGEYWANYLAEIRKIVPDNWQEGNECWLNYYCEADVQQWAEFLVPRLSTILSRCYADVQLGV